LNVYDRSQSNVYAEDIKNSIKISIKNFLTVFGITIQTYSTVQTTIKLNFYAELKLNGYAEDNQRHNHPIVNGYTEDSQRHNHPMVMPKTANGIIIQVEWLCR
jgi:hypothetical protein